MTTQPRFERRRVIRREYSCWLLRTSRRTEQARNLQRAAVDEGSGGCCCTPQNKEGGLFLPSIQGHWRAMDREPLPSALADQDPRRLDVALGQLPALDRGDVAYHDRALERRAVRPLALRARVELDLAAGHDDPAGLRRRRRVGHEALGFDRLDPARERDPDLGLVAAVGERRDLLRDHDAVAAERAPDLDLLAVLELGELDPPLAAPHLRDLARVHLA